MSTVRERVRAFVAAAGRRPDEQRATCPNDDLTFTPRYTDGVCPLCGWRPEGIDVRPPLTARTDWFTASLALMLVVSIAMGILVAAVYTR